MIDKILPKKHSTKAFEKIYEAICQETDKLENNIRVNGVIIDRTFRGTKKLTD
jgi:hypothetical protein